MRLTILTGVALIALAACKPAPQAVPDPVPEAGMAELFAGCTWQKVSGKTLSIWNFQCPQGHMNGSHLVADDSLPGFRLVSQSPDGEQSTVVLHAFKKPTDAPMDAILNAVRTASPGPHTDSCTLKPTASDPNHFTLEPNGEAAIAWENSQTNGGDTPRPCGAYGVDFVGDRYFAVLPDDPTTVIYLNMGSEAQTYDPKTVQVIK
jgi:hypothetical protein